MYFEEVVMNMLW